MIDTLPDQRLASPGTSLRRVSSGFNGLDDRRLESMLSAFRDHGGIMSGDAVAERMRSTCTQPISTLARWIVARSIISLAWQGLTLVPMFQFQPCDLSIRPCFSLVFDELKDTFDDWEAGLWFATPNVWLDDRAPVECLNEDWIGMLQAARTDRFIARG